MGCHALLQRWTLQIAFENLHRLMAAAAAAKSLQSCPTLCDPTDGSPPGSSIHGIFQARVLEWGAIAFSGTGDAIDQYFPSFGVRQDPLEGL